MQFKYACIELTLLFLACQAFSENCPPFGEKGALLQFLLDHKSNSLDTDPACVSRAFASLSHGKSYARDLVALLDFERSTQNDDHLLTRDSHYPAISALGNPDAVPYLIEAIKESESELVRTNAAEALDLAYSTCADAVVLILEDEAVKPEATVQEQDWLRAAGKYIRENHGGRPCKGARPTSR
jgi:HEAT repeat protein